MFNVLEKITALRQDAGLDHLSSCKTVRNSPVYHLHLVSQNLMPPIDKLEILCQTFGISLADFFNDTEIILSITEEEKNMLSQWSLLTPNQRKAVLNIMELLQTQE